MGNFNIFDIIIVLSGIYLIYNAIIMKKKGVINTTLIGKGCDLKRAKDIPGFIKAMYLKSLILGIITVLVGGIDYGNEMFWNISYLGPISSFIFLILILVYGRFSLNAQKKYLSDKNSDI